MNRRRSGLSVSNPRQGKRNNEQSSRIGGRGLCFCFGNGQEVCTGFSHYRLSWPEEQID